MDFIKKYPLKQYTPLIHFQHAQDGATLRASELKPKLDKVIWNSLKEAHGEEYENWVRDHRPEWLVGGGHAQQQYRAFDYKLSVNAQVKESYLLASYIGKGLQKEYDRKGIKYLSGVPYFADNEPIKKKKLDSAKRGIMFDTIELEIICLYDDLFELINDAFIELFCFQNFGIRQSKGFGCFFPAWMNMEEFEDRLLKHPLYKNTLVYRYEGRYSPKLLDLFKKIDLEYKILKSGLARDRSQMMEYFDQRGIHWEKPILKKELVKNRNEPSKKDYTESAYQYVRALLGVAELYEFPKDGREKLKIKCLDEEEGTSTPIVERFRSPITFKVFENNIYMLPEEIPDEIFDRRFAFENRSKHVIDLKTPSKEQFNLIEFLENHVEQSWHYVGE